MKFALRAALCAIALGGCDPPDPPSTQNCAAFAQGALVTNAAPSSLSIVAVAPRYDAGRVRSMSLRDLTVRPVAIEATGDTVLRSLGDALALLHRAVNEQDNLTLFHPPTGAVCQVPLVSDTERSASRSRPYANAHDAIALDAGHIVVARHTMPSLAIVDVAQGAVRDTIDLSSLRGAAPLPHPDALARVGDELWVTLERDDDPMRQHPTQRGLVARINPATHAIVGSIELAHPNPVGPLRASVDGSRRLVATVGSYNVVGDGAIESIDPVRGVSTELVTESEVEGNIDAFAVVDARRLALRVTAERQGTAAINVLRVVLFDLETRSARTLVDLSQWGAAGPVVVGDRLFVSDPGEGIYHVGAGVRVFSPDGVELRGAIAMDPGLMPYDVQPTP